MHSYNSGNDIRTQSQPFWDFNSLRRLFRLPAYIRPDRLCCMLPSRGRSFRCDPGAADADSIPVRRRPFGRLCAFACGGILCILMGLSAPLLAQSFWAQTQIGNNTNECLDVSGDATGNALATGYFSSTSVVSGTSLSSSGLTDIFLTRIQPNGQASWSLRAGGPGSDRGLSVGSDASGNVFVCGFFTGTASFGSGVSLTANSNSQDAFVAKYDPSGNALWARAGGSPGNSDRANALSVDNMGNVIITGQFSGEANFGTESLSSAGGNDVFIVKYSGDGDVLWALSGSGPGANRGLGITTDDAGNVYACGQFSNDISFDNSYSNSALNALFLVKLSAGGSEEWMRFAVGATQSIAYDVVSDGQSVFITGDGGSSLSFVNTPGNPQISNSNAQAIFLASFGESGNYQWGLSQGSSSPVSARAISYRGGELAVVGWFECTMDDFSGLYGESNFNSIGFRDVFSLRCSSSDGSVLWARNFGSHSNEVASGVHILPDQLEVISGTFTDQMTLPIAHEGNTGFSAISPTFQQVANYCGDAQYNQYSQIFGNPVEDGFLLKAIDPAREPYDYYRRFQAGACDRSIPPLCIYPGSAASNQMPMPCPELISSCNSVGLTATNYANHPSSVIGYQYSMEWSTGSSGSSIFVSSSGNYSVTITSDDACYSLSTEVQVEIIPSADPPPISDSQGVNTETTSPIALIICPGDSLTLTGHGPIPGQWFSGPLLIADGSTVTVSATGSYTYSITNSDGCTSSTSIIVMQQQMPEMVEDPYLLFNQSGDSLNLCAGSSISVSFQNGIDSTTVDPSGYQWTWELSPSGAIDGNSTAGISVDESGWYVVSVLAVQDDNPCLDQAMEYFLSDSVYVQLQDGIDLEAELNLAGDLGLPEAICEGDTLAIFIESNADIVTVSPEEGATIIGDTLYVWQSGSFTLNLETGEDAPCPQQGSSSFSIGSLPSPQISLDPGDGIICPGDSVLLSTSIQGELTWNGPGGSFAGDTAVYVSEAGLYFLEVEFYPSCGLVSNTVEVTEFSTPFISASDALLCPGDSLELTVLSSAGADINWLPPLSGSDPTQMVSEPGTYLVEVTACGFTSQIAILVESSEADLWISFADSDSLCLGDSVLVMASEGLLDYQWNFGLSDSSSAWVFGPDPVEVTALDSIGCLWESNVLQAFVELPPDEVPLFIGDPPCFGEPLMLELADAQWEAQWLGSDGESVLFTGTSIFLPSFTGDTIFYARFVGDLCKGPLDSIQLSPKPFPEEPLAISEDSICTGAIFALEVINAQSGVLYIWQTADGASFEGDLVEILVPDSAGAASYAVYANLDGCISDTVMVEVEFIQTRKLQLPADTTICQQSPLILQADTLFADYLWSDGSTAASLELSEAGTYSLNVVDFNGCRSFDDFHLSTVDCEVIIPNVFTPNGDGRNDRWVISVEQAGFFRSSVYNRWGELVFESDRVGHWWDGDHYQSGKPCPEGVYFYIVELLSFDQQDFRESGSLTLLRNRRLR